MHIIASEWGWLRYWKEPSPTAAFLTDLWNRCDALFHPQAFPSVAAVRLRWAEVEKEQVEAASTATSSSYGLLSAYWNVPPAPSNNDGQTVYLFPGSIPESDSDSHGCPTLRTARRVCHAATRTGDVMDSTQLARKANTPSISKQAPTPDYKCDGELSQAIGKAHALG